MMHSELLQLLLPPAAYDPRGKRIAGELVAEGAALDAALESSDRVADAITPFLARSLIVDWEQLLGIQQDASKPYLARIQKAVAKIRETGGLSIPYFVSLAAGLGYTITIVEPQPFRAGINAANDTVYDPSIIWQWRVDVQSTNVPQYAFKAGTSCAGERLLAFGDPVIETVFQDLKPAHTYVYFAYL